jgi:hypothetical protein
MNTQILMRRLVPYFLSLAFCLLAALKSDDLPALFTNRLARAQIVFTQPDKYASTPIRKNTQMHYEYALKHADRNFEVRYAVIPLDSVIIQFDSLKKDKNQGVFLEPNKLYTGAFFAIMSNISNRIRQSKIDAYPSDAARNEFNADWATFGLCEVDGEFGKGYKYCMAVAIHKDNLGDAYYFYLTDDKSDFQNLLPPIFYAMKFK